MFSCFLFRSLLFIVILSCSSALSPSFASLLFNFTLPCSISSSAFRLEQYPEFAMIFWMRSSMIMLCGEGLKNLLGL